MRSVDSSAYFKRADADDPAQLGLLVGGQVGAALGDAGAPALDRLVDEVDELHRVAAAALQHLAVGAEHVAEVDVHRACRRHQPAGHLGDLPHHLQVLRLRCADDVQQQRGAEALDTVDHAGQVAGRVVEAAGAGLHDQRQRRAFAVGVAGHPHHLGAVGLVQQPGMRRAVRGPPA